MSQNTDETKPNYFVPGFHGSECLDCVRKGLVNVDEELQHETVTAFMSFPFDFITLNKEI